MAAYPRKPDGASSKYPEIYIVSNVLEAAPIGSLGAGEAVWHTDMSYLENPPKASMLYSLEIPPNTYFCNMYGAYECLPVELQQRICDLRLKRDASYNSGGHETSRKALYLGRRRSAHIAGLPLEESEALLNELWSWPRDEFTWSTEWRAGGVAPWDNRCTIDLPDSYCSQSRRILHRTQIKGEHRPSA